MSRIIGIDLGTSTSEVACVIDGVPVLIPNSLGNKVTPSVVHITEDGAKLVGEPAPECVRGTVLLTHKNVPA